jgi:C-terminal processing protease CtpA/Prc
MSTLYKYNKYLLFILFGFILVFLPECEKDDVDPNDPKILARNEFYELMKEWYFWYDKMPDVDVEDYDTPEELLEALRYLQYDRFSYIASKTEFENVVQGKYIGHGFGYSFDSEGNPWIIFVFKDSPLYPEGVRRGWRMVRVNGQVISQSNIGTIFGDSKEGVENTIEFLTPSDSTVIITSAKKEIQKNTVLYSDTLHVAGKIVAHLVFEGFREPSVNELADAFGFFKNVGANEMILDLRYNPGGLTSVATLLGSLISGENTDNKLFFKYLHNDKKTSHDKEATFAKEPNSLNLQSLIVITSRSTYSASEIIINGLKPYLNVVTIGDATGGKPVGMYVWYSDYADYAFVPISFKIINANGEGDYFEGILPDASCEDDITRQFKDREETCLEEAIYYLTTGSFSGRKGRFVSQPLKERLTLEDEIGAI